MDTGKAIKELQAICTSPVNVASFDKDGMPMQIFCACCRRMQVLAACGLIQLNAGYSDKILCRLDIDPKAVKKMQGS